LDLVIETGTAELFKENVTGMGGVCDELAGGDKF